MGFTLDPPVEPMLAKLARSMPAAADVLYEPKWDGFRCLVFRDGDEWLLQSRNKKPLDRYFPELRGPLAEALPDRCVIDGEIVVPQAAGQGLNFDALLQRIHPAESRVQRLAAETPASFVAFDVLAVDDEVLTNEPFSVRRERLERIVRPVRGVPACVLLTPASTDRDVAERWFSTFEGAGLDGVIVKPLAGVYEPGKRSLVKVKHERTADCAVAGYRIHKDGNGVGSLLLGLFEGGETGAEPGDGSHGGDSGGLRSVGVAAAFTVKRRTELLHELEPLSHEIGDHPWASWSEAANDAGGQSSAGAGGSRWNAGKDLSFVPIRMGLVAEVTFGQLEGRRFRHGVKFVRWRPDRDPASCRFDQLDVAAPVDFHDFIDEAT